jgi:hypothetical protein
MRTLTIAACALALFAGFAIAQTTASKPTATTTFKPDSLPAMVQTSPSRPFFCMGYVPPAGMKVLRTEINIKDGKPFGDPVADEITYDNAGINTKGLAALGLPFVLPPVIPNSGGMTDGYDCKATPKDGVTVEWHYSRSQIAKYVEPFVAFITLTPKEGRQTSWRITQSE